MPRLAICSRDLHWQWINWAPLYDTMEVSMLRLTWLNVAQHVFQPALTGRLELILRKIVSCEPGTKAIAVSWFREKLSPTNWVQGDFAKNIALLGAKKWGPTCDRDISNSAIYATAIYRAYTVFSFSDESCFFFMPPPLGAGGIMFSGCPSVRPSVRPKPEIPPFDMYMGPLVHPTNRNRFTACPSVLPSVRPSVRRGFRAFAGECMEGMAWNFTCWCILTIFRTD